MLTFGVPIVFSLANHLLATSMFYALYACNTQIHMQANNKDT